MRTDIADVVVVGGGGTGLMSAYAAARHGRSVIVLEKGEQLGGTTRLSVGTICASSTELQKKAGIDDDPDSHFRDMELFFGSLSNRDNRELRRILVDEIPETIAILTDLGVEFMGPLPEPPHQKPRLHAIRPVESTAYNFLSQHPLRSSLLKKGVSRAFKRVHAATKSHASSRHIAA